MRPYFEKMTEFGKPLSDSQKHRAAESVAQIKETESLVAAAAQKVRNAGLPAETLNK